MAEPTQWAIDLGDELFTAAGDAARDQASGDDLGASIDRLGARLLYLKDAVPLALDAARQQGYRETQRGVSDWATETFGPAGSNCRVAARANEEMAELLRALSSDDAHPKAAEEVADIVIILYRLVERLGTNLHAEIDRKMAINRSRNWGRDGTGHGYHIPTTPAPKET